MVDEGLGRFTRELWWQWLCLKAALHRLPDEILVLETDPDPDSDACQLAVVEIWRCVQTILGSAAAISRILWPTSPRIPRDRLRLACQVTDDSPLHTRAVRNGLEHFNERLERYLVDERPESFRSDLVVGERRHFRDGTLMLRFFDPEEFVVEVMDVRVELLPLVAEVARVATAAREAFGPGSGRG